MIITLPKADLKEIALWLLRRRKRFCIQGHSMLPLLSPGDIILTKAIKRDHLKKGELVIFSHPFKKNTKMIKQVIDFQGNRIKVQGINQSDSLDSQSFGLINPNLMTGKASSILKSN